MFKPRIEHPSLQGRNFMSKKYKFFILIIISIIAVTVAVLTVIPQIRKPNEAKTAMLQKYDLNGLSVKEMVNKLDSVTNEDAGLNASITGTTLILFDNEKQYDFKLPTSEFYLSFAPYINSIHPCQKHNLISCRGEIKNAEFTISIIKKDGTVIMNQKVKSLATGFIGVWLPKNIEATLNVTYNGLFVSKDITTYNDSDTCLTTPLKLS